MTICQRERWRGELRISGNRTSRAFTGTGTWKRGHSSSYRRHLVPPLAGSGGASCPRFYSASIEYHTRGGAHVRARRPHDCRRDGSVTLLPACPFLLQPLPSSPYADNPSKATPELRGRSTLIRSSLKVYSAYVYDTGYSDLRRIDFAPGPRLPLFHDH